VGAPFGDYVLSSYTVACDRAEIVLRAQRQVPGDPRVTEIVFAGVVAYDFAFDNLGTILSDMTEHPLGELIGSHAERLREGARASGWAPFMKPDLAETIRDLETNGIHAFAIDSAIGLRGWVLARSFVTRAA